MAFWGIEVKPGKPFTHIFDGLKGRLHISMATLGTGTATQKSVLQCNVGNKSPVQLCSLFPEKTESLQINVEFEEAEEVIFSVLGPRSVHLSGYHLSRHQGHNFDDNSESYGEDIANSETQRSVDSEEEKYDDSFIDDDDPVVLLSSSSDSGEEVSDKKKSQNGNGCHRRLRKMYQLSESEMESVDEDRCPISSLCKSKSGTNNTAEEVEEKVDKRTVDTGSQKTEDDAFDATESIKDADDMDIDGQSKRKFDLPVDPLPPSSEVRPENGRTTKRKRKGRPKDEKSMEAGVLENEDEAQKDEATTDNRTQNLSVEDVQQQKVANHKGAVVPDDLSKPLTEVSPENAEKPKKKKKKRVEGKTFEVVSTNNGNVVVEDKDQQDEAKGDMCPDLPVKSERNRKLAKDGSGHDSDRFVVGQSDEKKVKKKKKSKTQAHGEDVNTDVPLLSAEENTGAKSSQVRTLSSGLSIEELEAGKPNGKIATSGKKVSVHFVGKLKENGKVFDCNTGSVPFKFRLGQRKVTEGWDTGLDGMRVGEKRRLVIPPEMGYGITGDGKDVPPNSWLVYDVELVKVH